MDLQSPPMASVPPILVAAGRALLGHRRVRSAILCASRSFYQVSCPANKNRCMAWEEPFATDGALQSICPTRRFARHPA